MNLSGNVRTLAFIQGASDYLARVPRTVGLFTLVTETEKACCVTATGKLAKKIYLPCKRRRIGAHGGVSTLCLNYFESLGLYIRRLRPLCGRADKLSAHRTPIKLTATVYLSSLLSHRTIASLRRPPPANFPARNVSRELWDSFRMVRREMLRCHRLNSHFLREGEKTFKSDWANDCFSSKSVSELRHYEAIEFVTG